MKVLGVLFLIIGFISLPFGLVIGLILIFLGLMCFMIKNNDIEKKEKKTQEALKEQKKDDEEYYIAKKTKEYMDAGMNILEAKEKAKMEYTLEQREK